MRIAANFLNELIAHTGKLGNGSLVTTMGVLRLALDLREAREKIAALESEITLLRAPTKSKKARIVTEERVVSRLGDPRSDNCEETGAVTQRGIGKKVSFRA
jgi:uncharacterized small protein (DUF1192 family)